MLVVFCDFLLETYKQQAPRRSHYTLSLCSRRDGTYIFQCHLSVLQLHRLCSYPLCPWEKEDANICPQQKEPEFYHITAPVCMGRKNASSLTCCLSVSGSSENNLDLQYREAAQAGVYCCLKCVSLCSPVKLGEGSCRELASRKKDQLQQQRHCLRNMASIKKQDGSSCPIVGKKDPKIACTVMRRVVDWTVIFW